MRQQMHSLERIKEGLKTLPDGQVSMTDPDTRSRATSGKVSGMAVRWRCAYRVVPREGDEGGAGYPRKPRQKAWKGSQN